MTGTHDTEPTALWWDDLPPGERELFARLPVIARSSAAGRNSSWSDRLRDAILELAYGAGSDHLFVPIQDLFGWRDRINTPGTVTPQNWTWCLPWPVDRIEQFDIARERAEFLHELARTTSRLGGLH